MMDGISTETTNYPAEFLTAIEKEKITAKEVGAILAEFQMTISLDHIAKESRAIVVTSINQTELMEAARRQRIAYKNERNRLDKARKEIKEPYLRKTQVIDGAGRIIRRMFEEEESYLEQQETFKERHYAEIRKRLVSERTEALTPFVEDMTPFLAGIGVLNQEVFDNLLEREKRAFLQREEEARQQAEAKKAEDERLQRENDELRERNRLAELEAANAKAEKEKAERQKAEAEAETLRIKQESEAEALRVRQESERKERERIAAEEAEKKRLADEKAKEAAAPDREKLIALADATVELLVDSPRLESDDANRLLTLFTEQVTSAVAGLRSAANNIKANVDPSCPF